MSGRSSSGVLCEVLTRRRVLIHMRKFFLSLACPLIRCVHVTGRETGAPSGPFSSLCLYNLFKIKKFSWKTGFPDDRSLARRFLFSTSRDSTLSPRMTTPKEGYLVSVISSDCLIISCSSFMLQTCTFVQIFFLSIFSKIKVRPGSLRNTQKTGKMRFL